MEYDEPSADGFGVGIGFVSTTGALVGVCTAAIRDGSGTETLRQLGETGVNVNIVTGAARGGGIQVSGEPYDDSGCQAIGNPYTPGGAFSGSTGSRGAAASALNAGDALYLCIFVFATADFSVTPGTVRITKLQNYLRSLAAP